MSIQSEITRLSENVSDALAAIERKGVIVPEGSNSNDLEGLIDQISSGGLILISDTLDENGGTVREIDATDAIVVDSLDENGGTIRNINGVEVYLQEKIAIPSETIQNITPDSGYTALSNVRINAVSSDYIGSNVPVNPTITASGATVTIPKGYYDSQKTKSIDGGSATVPGTIFSAPPTISVGTDGLISASVNRGVSVTPNIVPGYISSGTSGTVTAQGSSTLQLATKSAATYTPSTSTQTIAAGQYLTGAQTIGAIPSQYIIPSGNKEITENGDNIDVTSYATVSVDVPQELPNLQTKSVTPTESAQQITADSGYDGLEQVNVGAISSSYVGSGISRKSSSDLTVSGATVTAPAGYYEGAATKTISSGSVSSPTATKSTVSNHSISITPSVSYGAGYISDGTLIGSSVSVSVNELTSGTKTISENGTVDVTNYQSASVSVKNTGDYYARIKHLDNYTYSYVTINNVKYYLDGEKFFYNAGDTLSIYVSGSRGGGFLYIMNELVQSGQSGFTYNYTLPDENIDIEIIIDINGTIKITSNKTVDMPVFTIIYDENWENISSVICNKSFADCYSLMEDDFNYCATAIITNELDDDIWYQSFCGRHRYDSSMNEYLEYTCIGQGSYEIILYFGDNDITYNITLPTAGQSDIRKNKTAFGLEGFGPGTAELTYNSTTKELTIPDWAVTLE